MSMILLNLKEILGVEYGLFYKTGDHAKLFSHIGWLSSIGR